MANSSRRHSHGSLATGAITGLALAVQTGLAALVGVIISQEFGRSAETDGFFAAYAVFVTFSLAATAIRVTVLPRFTRAREAGRLSGEVMAVGRIVTATAAPLIVVCVFLPRPIAAALTGFGGADARGSAAQALPWMAVAAAGQLLAGLLASAWAALDEYAVPAFAFVVGSVVGLLLILVRLDEDGLAAVAWGISLNAVGVCVVSGALLLRRAAGERMPRGAIRAADGSWRNRLAELGGGTSLLLALQLMFVVCLATASREGVGSASSFSYAFLIGSAVVSVSAMSLGLVTSVPLTRAGLTSDSAARHVEAASWIALLAIGATGGMFAVSGGSIISAVLGSGYSADAGAELGRVIVAFVPWMVATVGIAVVFPLVFVDRHASRLPLISIAAVAAQVPLAFGGEALAGLAGLAVSLALATMIPLVAMLDRIGSVGPTASLVWPGIVTVGSISFASFALPGLMLDGIAPALLGLGLYVALFAVARPRRLRESWAYLRALG